MALHGPHIYIYIYIYIYERSDYCKCLEIALRGFASMKFCGVYVFSLQALRSWTAHPNKGTFSSYLLCFSVVLVTLGFFLLIFTDFCKSSLRFLNRIGPLWSIVVPLWGQGRLCSELLRFGHFWSLSMAKTVLGQKCSVFDHSGPFQRQGCSGASCPGPAGAFPEYAPAMRRQLPDDNGQGLLFLHMSWKYRKM